MRTKFFAWLAGIINKRPGTVLIVCACITIAMLVSSGRITMKTQIADMMPKHLPMAQEFKAIIDEFESASSVMIAVESKEKDMKRMKACADEIAARLRSIKTYKPAEGQKLSVMQNVKVLFGRYPVEGVVYDTVELVKRIDYKLDNEFIAEHGMMMQKPKDLQNFQDMFTSLTLPGLIENINDNLEKEFIDDADNMTTLDGESDAVQGLESMYKFVHSIGTYMDTHDTAEVSTAVRSFITGPEYFISPDNTLLLVMLQPTVDMDNFEDAMFLGYRIVDSLNAIRNNYPDLEIGGTGWMLIQIDEMEASKKDFGWPSLIALGLILLLLIGSFRTWKNPFFSVVTLVIAIIWTAGLLALILHYLDMMSAAFVIILIGLGIDFGIHFISGFRDGRELGLSVPDAIHYMYDRVGSGVITGALTTAIVFFSLTLTGFKAFSRMGISIGTGIVLTMIAAMVLLPALIVWDNKGHSITGNLFRTIHCGFIPDMGNRIMRLISAFFRLQIFNHITSIFQFTFLEISGKILARTPMAIMILFASLALMGLSIRAGQKIQFEYDMMQLEPIGIPTVIVQDKILDKLEISPDYAMLKAKNVDDCREKIAELKKVGNRTGVIGGVDGVTEFIPTPADQEANIPLIQAFREKIEHLPIPPTLSFEDAVKLDRELVRLHQNIVEIGELSVMGSGEGNKIIRKCDQIVGKKDEDSKILALAEKIRSDPDNIPALASYQSIMSAILKDRLIRMASIEPLTLESLPATISERYVSPRTGEMLITVYPKSNIWDEKILRKFTEETAKVSDRVTGTPPMMLMFIDLIKEKGRLAILIGAVAIFLFLLIDFRSLKYALLAIIPLAAGASWMIGLMAVLGIKFNFVNFMCLPLILGIGIDDGVHILHRYIKEGRGSVPMLLKYTGRAILLTSLTTMIGFGSMGMASHRGTASMGQVLFLGVGACFMSSAYLLPAIITLWEKNFNNKNKNDKA
jgi:hypothetical protein